MTDLEYLASVVATEPEDWRTPINSLLLKKGVSSVNSYFKITVPNTPEDGMDEAVAALNVRLEKRLKEFFHRPVVMSNGNTYVLDVNQSLVRAAYRFRIDTDKSDVCYLEMVSADNVAEKMQEHISTAIGIEA